MNIEHYMRADNQIVIISKSFALRIIKLYTYLKEEKKEYVMSTQLLRSGTSIGANVRESINAQSKADDLAKILGTLTKIIKSSKSNGL